MKLRAILIICKLVRLRWGNLGPLHWMLDPKSSLVHKIFIHWSSQKKKSPFDWGKRPKMIVSRILPCFECHHLHNMESWAPRLHRPSSAANGRDESDWTETASLCSVPYWMRTHTFRCQYRRQWFSIVWMMNSRTHPPFHSQRQINLTTPVPTPNPPDPSTTKSQLVPRGFWPGYKIEDRT